MANYVTNTSDKNKKVALLLCCLGYVGVGGLHYFYVGRYIKGLLYLCTGGLCMICTIIDTIKIASGGFKDNVGAPLRQ